MSLREFFGDSTDDDLGMPPGAIPARQINGVARITSCEFVQTRYEKFWRLGRDCGEPDIIVGATYASGTGRPERAVVLSDELAGMWEVRGPDGHKWMETGRLRLTFASEGARAAWLLVVG